MKKQVKKKLLGCTQLGKRLVSNAVTNIPIINLNVYPNIYFCESIFLFERNSNQFFNLIVAIEFPRRHTKDIWHSKATSENQIGILSLLSKFLKYNFKRVHFWQFCRYRPPVLQKKEFFPRHFSRIFSNRFSWQNYRTLLNKIFSIRTPVGASVYAKNSLKK